MFGLVCGGLGVLTIVDFEVRMEVRCTGNEMDRRDGFLDDPVDSRQE